MTCLKTEFSDDLHPIHTTHPLKHIDRKLLSLYAGNIKKVKQIFSQTVKTFFNNGRDPGRQIVPI